MSLSRSESDRLGQKESPGRLILKVFLSLWLCYHVLVMLVVPNPSSFVIRYLGSGITAYANQLMINTGWGVFAPDPAAPSYVEYSVYFDQDSEQRTIHGAIPIDKEKLSWQPNRRREFYFMVYLISNPERAEKVLIPWLCEQHPRARKVKARLVGAEIRSLDQVLLGSEKTSSLKRQKKSPAIRGYCQESEDV